MKPSVEKCTKLKYKVKFKFEKKMVRFEAKKMFKFEANINLNSKLLKSQQLQDAN